MNLYIIMREYEDASYDDAGTAPEGLAQTFEDAVAYITTERHAEVQREREMVDGQPVTVWRNDDDARFWVEEWATEVSPGVGHMVDVIGQDGSRISHDTLVGEGATA